MCRLFNMMMVSFIAFNLHGCATIVSGTTQTINVNSSPAGATVKAEPGGIKTTTPGKLDLKRSTGPYKITFSLDQYEPYSATLITETNGWAWGNLLFGGIIGVIVDGSTGAATKLSPDTLNVTLVKSKITPSETVDNTLGNQESIIAQPDNKTTHK